jgi:hypothetical protein
MATSQTAPFLLSLRENYPLVVGPLSIVADALADRAPACLEETTQEKGPLLPAARSLGRKRPRRAATQRRQSLCCAAQSRTCLLCRQGRRAALAALFCGCSPAIYAWQKALVNLIGAASRPHLSLARTSEAQFFAALQHKRRNQVFKRTGSMEAAHGS